jgi:hypothetical protein
LKRLKFTKFPVALFKSARAGAVNFVNFTPDNRAPWIAERFKNSPSVGREFFSLVGLQWSRVPAAKLTKFTVAFRPRFLPGEIGRTRRALPDSRDLRRFDICRP